MTTSLAQTGIVFPDSTVQTTSAKQLGIDQTYITPSRALGTTYTNTTTKPIWISVVAAGSGGFAGLYLTVNGISVQTQAHGPDSGLPYFTVSGIVPPGNTYVVSGSSLVSLVSWTELS